VSDEPPETLHAPMSAAADRSAAWARDRWAVASPAARLPNSRALPATTENFQVHILGPSFGRRKSRYPVDLLSAGCRPLM